MRHKFPKKTNKLRQGGVYELISYKESRNLFNLPDQNRLESSNC